jgi:hypothetical protein
MPKEGRDPNKNMMVARDAIVVVVGARPIEYGRITVRHNKTGELVEIDNHNDIVDEGSEGTPYAFRAYQRVHKSHPAVKANPGAFLPADEVDETVLEVSQV